MSVCCQKCRKHLICNYTHLWNYLVELLSLLELQIKQRLSKLSVEKKAVPRKDNRVVVIKLANLLCHS